MSIAAINEQLLRSIGVGVAIVRASDLTFSYSNEAFADWFGAPEAGGTLLDVMPVLKREDLDEVCSGGTFTGEIQIKPKRRTLVIAVTLTLAQNGAQDLVVVECQNITRMRELEKMIDSYSSMVERNTRELEREKERVERLLLNLMPRSVYEEYKTFGVVTPQLYLKCRW